MKKIVIFLCLSLIGFKAPFAQTFTHADTLRGSNGPGRDWWNATKYSLYVKFNLEDSTISGYNVISFKVLKPHSIMQIDLQEPMILDSIANELKYENGTVQNILYDTDLKRDGNAYFINFTNNMFKKGAINNITVYYHGKPRTAKRPPWDGGLIWARDKGGNPWITIACQGLGASVWYPCKDYQGDEPDSAEMHIIAPSDLVAVSNGRMRSKVNNGDGTTTTAWSVVNPINNYDLIPYLGKYVHFGEIYHGEKGPLTMDYWVLDSDLVKAKSQFKDATRMMKAFEYWFGPYPFYEDGYKLVEAPHLGMEHQSAVAYGNHFMNGYLGRDVSGTGVGLNWDFIIVHESGHEWFGNNITSKDIADMWIHEGFASYSEALFTEYYYGKKAATGYVAGIRKNIKNDKPIIGPYGVNKEGTGDMYSKADNMIHLIRQIINNDEKFRQILRGLNKAFYHQTVTSKQIENYISQNSGIDFSKVFDQYLRTTKIPTLEYKINNGILSYKWTNVVPGFRIPLRIYNGKGELQFIYPAEKMKQIKLGISELKIDENFYIYTNQIN
ncbi:M1 family metallopeptidase [Ginsengibacter hankyongi]|uniref:M1 family metallopeptidase n=1 Tax=Ginsengibacter hankyongi TaxID=2607284 RepID=A0A5J5IC02_9BACT|nr:M1 family metallopeptidase [Ginsengibacter hankyongi]KAA9036078.1 M1 family metallopeptidase [Ginsengibacter hankyongi]